MALILLWSILTNLVAIFAIIILYVRQNRLIHAEKSMHMYAGELEEAITAFLLEVKEENEKLKAFFMEKEKQRKAEPNSVGNHDGAAGVSQQKNQSVLAAENTYPILFQVLKLRGQGKSIDEIAKEMDKEKTEIELLIKMYE